MDAGVMMDFKTLHETPWLSLRQIEDENYTYVYSHETRCNGHIVAVLPFRLTADMPDEFLLRSEVTPSWGPDPAISAITGGVDSDNTPEETALHELAEEAGLICQASDLISLGTCRGTKSSDTLYHLYAVDATNKRQQKAKGDGSYLETLASCFWTSSPEVAVDPTVAVMVLRTQGLRWRQKRGCYAEDRLSR